MSMKSIALKSLLALPLALFGSAEQADEQNTDALVRSLPISYGHCYHVVNANNEYLGHDATGYHFLQFGSQASAAGFKICSQPGFTCGLNQPDAVVDAGQPFYLYDFVGNILTASGNTIVSNTAGQLLAGGGAWNQYVEFTATNERSDTRTIRVHARDHWAAPHDGLSVNGLNYLITDYNHGSSLLNFVETDCRAV
ncbi:hypothetical protein ASPVEDRAFT_27516 [Aspergillus versicolor CBS 583.65]|uniref:Uncharacterized protein n=1 Tax=Aspergillus versicolor CBS 583.65 TaxID=1036611 RepID=A0A1L9PH07_ASPVE|nr:uncharacterized protein ASPVEDRAFT_27516 [Aspergillus versicolor CBS 583.65]OJJ00804.1 hypothetical protein ASPVEDRAFT_27516 [Aspergillus versicolor CBS 583.65]